MYPPADPLSGSGRGPDGAQPERLLGGRYQLVKLAGKGAMGRVWAAHDQVLNRPVAIKEVDFPRGMPVSETEQVARRTMREARAIASVSDPHVVTIYDMLVLPHGPAIVMELLTARSLAEVLAVDGPLSESEAVIVGLAVASGLLAAHSAGITHRDVKPGNVLMCQDGRIKLTDFGIARSAGEQTITATGLLLGSPAYISPEVASGFPATPRSDAWGLGALLFACVEGVPPFDRGSPMATLTAVIQDPVPAHPHSGRLTGVIRGLLTKDPATRMTVTTAHDALRRAAGGTMPPPFRWQSPASPRRADPAPGVAAAPAPPTDDPHAPAPGRSAAPTPGRSAAPPPGRSAAPPPGRSAAPPTERVDERPPGRGVAPAPGQGAIAAPGTGPAATPATFQRGAALPRPAAPRPTSPTPPVDVPPPPWAGGGASALRPIPVRAPDRTPARRAALAVMACLLGVLAAIAGYLGVRTVAHLENGTPVMSWSASARG